MQSLFQQWVVAGGVAMVALVPCLILSLAFAVQGILSLRRSQMAPEDFVDRLREAANQSGVAAARAALEEDHSRIAEIVRSVDAQLRRNPGSDSGALLRDEAESECDLLLQQNSPLALIVRIAPQLGLIGTLVGLHGAFAMHGSGSPDGKALAAAIGGALVPMVWGVVIAFISHLAHYMIQLRIAGYEQSLFPREGAAALQVLGGES
ncbi:MAG TPA: MotA/TolQ/ExbB proton channel family protein [Candidatus Sumerlaeota bacterium]|nr:MotA/TolQ/ExbB proton channel family protein [Candidatus Sumerlaeota bacterium]HNM47590.1 MotA/TolQ/ExbB proton channel family protein [Candidatus Sumerlaeota bacterium]